MASYLSQRILLMIPSLIGTTVLTFVLLRVLLPADAVDIILGEYGGNNPALRERIEEDLGLNGSLAGQYLEWVGISWFFGGETGILQGDLGNSLHSNRPIIDELKRRVPVSFELGLAGQLLAIVFSIPIGVAAAVNQDKLPDYGLRSLGIVLYSVPNFWIAILAIIYGSLWFQWAPPTIYAYIWDSPIQHLKTVWIPILVLALAPSGGLIRLVRTQMLEVMRQDYVRTAQSKGLGFNAVVYKHALRNALIPIVTVIGVGLPGIIAGTVVLEQIFVVPGMGRYLVDSLTRLDYPVIMALNLVFALLLMTCFILIDVCYALIDPRIRFK
jgi:peptide/nickel transport system permease protein